MEVTKIKCWITKKMIIQRLIHWHNGNHHLWFPFKIKRIFITIFPHSLVRPDTFTYFCPSHLQHQQSLIKVNLTERLNNSIKLHNVLYTECSLNIVFLNILCNVYWSVCAIFLDFSVSTPERQMTGRSQAYLTVFSKITIL